MTRLIHTLAPWVACFLGFFAILIISTHLATGIACILACAFLLSLPDGTS